MGPLSDPYRALGLPRGATEVEIKAAHRRLAKRYHPDSDGGDTVRFLQVQEAYKLLVDPLQRREWDARHSAGPVRASDRAQPRPRAANGRWTKPEQATSPPPEPGPAASPERNASSRSYTWSASEVPWWEEGGARENRRQPGRKRPREPAPEPSGGPSPEPHAAPDFDVYNRSSGAAWSMAARAHFRRGDTDLPRRGSFRQQGGAQPLTAARARVAAEEEARRGRTASAAAAPRARQHPPRPAASGVLRDAESIGQVRAAARREALAARWPSLGQRLLYALLAWLPVALLIGYGGAWATGCDRASVSCPAELAPIQTVAIALALGLLVALPRLAYALAAATAGALLAGMALVFGIWALGLRPPLPSSVLLVSSALLLLVHLTVAGWFLTRGARRPLAARRVNRGRGL
jgi:curved DNA-binding protein CbpA